MPNKIFLDIGDILPNFEMDVTPSMTNVIGRVIKPPILKLGYPNGRSSTINLRLEKCHSGLHHGIGIDYVLKVLLGQP